MKAETYSTLVALRNTIPSGPQGDQLTTLIDGLLAQSNIREQMYTYLPNNAPLTLAAASAGQTTLAVQGDAPFLILAGSILVLPSAGATALTLNTTPLPLITVAINDQSGPGNIQSAAYPATSIFGLPGQPLAWPRPYLIPANSNLILSLANLDTVVSVNVYLSFLGFKLFNAQP